MSAPGEREVFGLLEMGSNSLKLYVVPRDAAADAGEIETTKFPWRVAHDLFGKGALAPATTDEVVACVGQAALHAMSRDVLGMLAIATGVFRELPDMEALAARITAETGVVPRVIGGQDEASLMARGFRELAIAPPAVMFDLGGASLEWAWKPGSGPTRAGSLPLGAIRNAARFAPLVTAGARYLADSAGYCDELLRALPITGTARVVATGGTAEALAAVVGAERVGAAELGALIERVQREGAPETLKPGRREVFLPGLVILSRVVARCGADGLSYGTSAVRLGMVRRLIQLLEKFPPSELRATQLLRVTQHRG
jgi:exopolyphosphatase/pppGpp-phosphohydrolase